MIFKPLLLDRINRMSISQLSPQSKRIILLLFILKNMPNLITRHQIKAEFALVGIWNHKLFGVLDIFV